MEKHTCCVCERDIGLFTGKSALKDGVICHKCLKMVGFSSFPSLRQFTVDKARRIIKARIKAIKNFHATNHFGKIEIDTNTHSFKINGVLYLFNNLIGYAYHEDPINTHIQNQNGKNNGAAIGGIIGGMRGGLIGGAVGAAVGSAVGSIFSTTCNSMSISISLKDVPVSDLHLHFITDKTKTSSSEYVQAVKDASSCLEALQIIKQQNEYMRLSRHQTESIRSSSPEEPRNVFIQDKHFTAKQLTEELDVYKALLYNGDITQEEFDQKRKQLLDLK